MNREAAGATASTVGVAAAATANSAGKSAATATTVGRRVAERGVAAGVTQVVFDRGPYLYHCRVKALGDAAREGGLQF